MQPERAHAFERMPDVLLGCEHALCECSSAPRAVNSSEQPGSVASSAMQYTRFRNVSSSCVASALSAGHIRSNCMLLTVLCYAGCVRMHTTMQIMGATIDAVALRKPSATNVHAHEVPRCMLCARGSTADEHTTGQSWHSCVGAPWTSRRRSSCLRLRW